MARQEQMRDQNLAVALRAIIDAVKPLSRAQLAAQAGLARATVTGLVDQLVEAGLVRELEPTQTQRAGRPAVPLVAQRGTVAGLGMEINVDYLGVLVIDLAGDVLAERVEFEDLRNSDPKAVLGRLMRIADDVVATLDGVSVAGSALALPGLVDRVTGPLRIAPRLGWRDVDVIALLGGPRPRLANEAKLAARAEAHARRGGSFVYVSGEVGVGGAIVLDGELFRGRRGWNGEIGHIRVDGGSLEEVAGQHAMLRAAGIDPVRRLEALLQALDAGDSRAQEAVAQAGRSLGVALAAAVNVVDVPEVVLGGTFGRLFDHVRGPVQEELDASVIFAPWAPLTVSRARAGAHPAMKGAALAVLNGVLSDPARWLRTARV
ncbi:ROK family protein [Cellulomonas sp. URHD0024]|uniref:ROK family protein n=1 Tax=Cellulomonas sp. URHD0024 TaxID=1302620 RepID=UPI00040E1228|nr:ROK family protein [Cellulomonas sp. URHD0024]